MKYKPGLTFINSCFSRLTRWRITAERVPSYLPKLWPPKQGRSAISMSGGYRKPYLKQEKENVQYEPIGRDGAWRDVPVLHTAPLETPTCGDTLPPGTLAYCERNFGVHYWKIGPLQTTLLTNSIGTKISFTCQILSDGAGGKLRVSVPLTECSWSCRVMFRLVMFFLTHSVSAILATKSDLSKLSIIRARNPAEIHAY